MSPSINQVVPVQVSSTSRQRGVAAAPGTETVRPVGELRLVIRLQQEPDHLADKFIRPDGRPSGLSFPFFFGIQAAVTGWNR